MLAHGVGKRRAAFHFSPHRLQHTCEHLVLLLLRQSLQALHQRKTRVDHDGELPGKDRQLFGLYLSTQFGK